MNSFKSLLNACLVFGSVCCSCQNLNLAPTLPVAYDEGASSETYAFQWSSPDEPYLTQLRTEFGLDALVAGAANDTERAEAVCAWVNGLWEHNGSRAPAQSDPIFIIREAQAGNEFRCVEYSIVVAGCLNSLGIPARVLGIKTADVETRLMGAGHVVAEAFLPDLAKWVLIDGQWGTIPFSGTTPLSGIELQTAIADSDPGLNYWALNAEDSASYSDWISAYLYFFDVGFDNRVGDTILVDRYSHRLMLVPLGDEAPDVFQVFKPLRDIVETHSVTAFYAAPILV